MTHVFGSDLRVLGNLTVGNGTAGVGGAYKHVPG